MSRDSIELIRMKGAKTAFGAARSSEFGKAAEEAPFMIRSLGLGSGIAALAAKGGERFSLAAMIAKWLFDESCPAKPYDRPDPPPDPNDDKEWVKTLLKAITNGSRAQYRTGQIEAMGYAGWIKRLAQAFCPKEDE